MKKIKLLTGDIYGPILNSEERVAILQLRTLISKLTKSEAVGLGIVLVNSYSLTVGRWIGVSALRGFSQDLVSTLLLIPILSPSSKLAIAIELLENALDRDTLFEDGDDSDIEEV